ncbi:MAG: Thiamine biosynthesis lipoprotein ApbE precursor [Planctomycetota bacterium]
MSAPRRIGIGLRTPGTRFVPVSLCALACVVAGCRAPRGEPIAEPSAEAAALNAADSKTLHRFTGHAMGSRVEITIDEPDADLARRAGRAALVELERLDRMLSDWKRESELSRLNRSEAREAEVSAEFAEVLSRALAVAGASGGRFDPTVGPCVRLWRASGMSSALPEPIDLREARARTGWRRVSVEGATVRREPDVELDFGGIGKGYGAVRALAAARAAGCDRTMVAVSGDIAAGAAPRGQSAWVVAIEPESAALPVECLDLVEGCVSTSGGAIQWIEIGGVRYAHIVDPRTGLGATTLAQATVVGPLDSVVDALGTALALCEDDDAAQAILDRFPGCRARLERDGVARWLSARPEGSRP